VIAAQAPAAWAGGARSFVSGGGTDAGTCERVSPCRTFGFAITQTNTGGEIVALDSSGYGPVTITKEITIVAPEGVHAGISPSSGGAITVNAPAGADVVLRNLTLRGNGSAFGIGVDSGDVIVDDTTIVGWSRGIVSGSSLVARIRVVDSELARNDIGIHVVGPGAGAVARRLVITNSVFRKNDEGVSTENQVRTNISHSRFTKNASAVVASIPDPTSNLFVSASIDDCQIGHNIPAFGRGVIEAGNGGFASNVVRIVVGRSQIADNGDVVSAFGTGAGVFTFGDNAIDGNTSAVFSGTVSRG
jgi:hypothetical protein